MEIPKRPKRTFLPDDLTLNGWDDLKPFFEDLKNRPISNVNELEKWLRDVSETEAVLEENLAWRYIKMSIDTKSEEKRKAYEFFVTEIQPKLAPYSHAFDKKLIESPYREELDPKEFEIPLKKAEKNIAVYREENIPIISKLQTESQKFGVLSGAMEVEVDGETITMQKAASLLKDTDRTFRKEVYEKITEQRLMNREAFHKLFDSLIKDRHQLAVNAGYANYRDYMFDAMQRFDYTPEDCFSFHDSVEKMVVPIANQLTEKRKAQLGVDTLQPYDMAVDPLGNEPLKPFTGGKELVDRTVRCFHKLDPFFGECISVMDKMGHLDLESKKGKSPGGYNYPLYEIGVPFIFMNAVGTVRDLVTMVHEGGHAIHSFLSRDLSFTAQKNLTSEVAELASMAMELLSMEGWDEFFADENELNRAKREHLEDVMSTLPWIALIDIFQHWIYENPNHTWEEREEKWVDLHKRFSSDLIDFSDYEAARRIMWQKQLHLFEVPFYYIEYGMAQLGAIAVFRNYRNNRARAIEQYKEALSLGYKRPIGEVYQTAGIQFDFSESYIEELTNFIGAEVRSFD